MVTGYVLKQARLRQKSQEDACALLSGPKNAFAFVYFWLLPIRLDLDSLLTKPIHLK